MHIGRPSLFHRTLYDTDKLATIGLKMAATLFILVCTAGAIAYGLFVGAMLGIL